MSDTSFKKFCEFSRRVQNMSKAIPNFEPFLIVHMDQATTSSMGIRWKKWLHRFNNLMVEMDISSKKRKRALLLHLSGTEVYDIFEPFTDEQKRSEDDFDQAVESLSEYFSPKKNIEFQTHKFRLASQRQDETLDSFHTRLRHLATTYEFTDPDREIKTKIVRNCSSPHVRKRALREQMTLQQLLHFGRAYELSGQ